MENIRTKPLQDNAIDDKTARFTFFWLDTTENGCFSNWYRSPFVIAGQKYFCVEQYMMAEKARVFGDMKTMNAILRSNSPKECKSLGRAVSPFDGKRWGSMSYKIVKTASRAKYEQNPPLMQALLATGSSILAEASPFDRIWGIGLDADIAAITPQAEWPGENRMGRILTELRTEYREKE